MQELTLKEIQNQSLKILKVIANICESQKLKYVLFYGTLIGAVRHKGFIPWDDDIDILMPRADYKKLQKYFVENREILQPLFLFSPETTNNYPYMIGRVCNTDYKMVAENEDQYGMGTFVDIYPLDGAGNGKHNFLYFVANVYASMFFMNSRQHFAITDRKNLNTVKKILFYFSKKHSQKYFYNKLMKIANKYEYEKSNKIGCMTWLNEGKDDIISKEDIEDTVLTKFEDSEFRIPRNYDLLLRRIYGDYMELPPVEKRIGHHFYKIYKK